VIEREFEDAEGAEPVSFSHSDFGLVVQALDYAARKLFSGTKIIKGELAVGP